MNINDASEKVRWIERLVKLGPKISKWVESWKYSGFIKLLIGWIMASLFIVTFLMTFYCFKAIKNGLLPPGEVIALYSKNTEEATMRAIAKDRVKETRKDSTIYALSNKVELSVNELAESYRYKLDADRVTITIFHDTEKMAPNLHFRFFSECYEKVNYDRGVPEIAQDFQKVKTSLFPIFSYLSIHKTVYGGISYYESIDMRYAHRLMENNCGWLGLRFLRTSEGREIGVLTVSWLNKDLKYKPEYIKIKEATEETAVKLEALFDLKNPNYNIK